MDFNEKIKILRRERGLTQAEAAKALGVPKHNIGAYEDGRAKPPYETLKKMVDFYQIPKNELYDFIFE